MPELVTDNTGFGAWQRGLIKNERHKPTDCRENVYMILLNHPVWKDRVALDEFSNRIMLREAPEVEGFAAGEWTSHYDLQLGLWLAQVMGLAIRNEKTLGHGVMMAANERRFHPVRDYFDSLQWDQIPRLDTWLSDFLGAKQSDYLRLVGRFFFLNMVARVADPGCIMRSVPVLEGAQNRGKSTALRILGDPWFSDSHLDVGNKDSYQTIQGVLLYEISEMASFSRAEVSRVKEFISSREDNFRAPYERRNSKVQRQVVFAGTTNEQVYLSDWTGNTRYWPVRVEEVQPIELDGLAAARDQLFAEAVVAHAAKERRHPTREQEAELFAPEQEQREIEHPWVSIIQAWVDRKDDYRRRATSAEIMSDCLRFESSKMMDTHSRTVGRIMLNKLGWARKREGGGSRAWFYERPPEPPAQPIDESKVPF